MVKTPVEFTIPVQPLKLTWPQKKLKIENCSGRQDRRLWQFGTTVDFGMISETVEFWHGRKDR